MKYEPVEVGKLQSSKFNILILGSDTHIRSELDQHLIYYFEAQLHILPQIQSTKGAIEWLQSNETPDLIIADTQLLDGLCFEVFYCVDVTCPILIVSDASDYAIQAIKFNCIDYILKSSISNELEHTLRRLIVSIYQNNRPYYNDASMPFGLKPNAYSTYKIRFMIKVGDKLRHISVDDIAYFYAENDYTYLVAWENSKFLIDYKLEHLNQILDPQNFFRISRKFITNIHSIKLVNKYSNSRMQVILEPKPKEQILISRARVPEFLGWMER